jgi:hypothetical protein
VFTYVKVNPASEFLEDKTGLEIALPEHKARDPLIVCPILIAAIIILLNKVYGFTYREGIKYERKTNTYPSTER